MKRVRECVHGAELGLQTLVWPQGAGFPLTRLESLLKCPRCGSRRVVLLFEPPSLGARTVGWEVKHLFPAGSVAVSSLIHYP